jgi:hypothetical protein
MKRKFQVRFLGGSGAERLPSYPVRHLLITQPPVLAGHHTEYLQIEDAENRLVSFMSQPQFGTAEPRRK